MGNTTSGEQETPEQMNTPILDQMNTPIMDNIGGDSSESDVGTLNWEQVAESIKNVESIKSNVNVDDDDEGGSSPFISEHLYNKIMDGGNGEDDTSSPFISSEDFKKIMKGGDIFEELENEDDDDDEDKDDEDEESSDDELMAELSQITLTSEEMNESKPKHDKHKFNKHNNKKHKNHNKKRYNFSETSSEFVNKNYVGGDSDSQTSIYKVDSDSINTSDINIVSVDSVNGRRYI